MKLDPNRDPVQDDDALTAGSHRPDAASWKLMESKPRVA